MTTIRTIAAPARHEPPRVRGSRFIGLIERAADGAAVDALLERVRAALPGATHYAYAARLDDGTPRTSDDGEVRGCAGLPILARLIGADLQGAALVVVRYYGGTKLGKGGLIRAYGEAAAGVLAAASVVEVPVLTRTILRCPYALSDRLQAQVLREGGAVVAADYGTSVTLTLDLPDGLSDSLRALLTHPDVLPV
jgi:putative IMPACT (imprinted ancient) family translation regulator